MQIWKIGYDANRYNILTFVEEILLIDEKNTYDGRRKIDNWEKNHLKGKMVVELPEQMLFSQ
jgi:hypothetical protein